MIEQLHSEKIGAKAVHEEDKDLSAEFNASLRRLERIASSLETNAQSNLRSVSRIADFSDAIAEGSEQLWRSAERIRRKQRLNRLTAAISLFSIAFWGYAFSLPEGRAFLNTVLNDLAGAVFSVFP